MSAGPASGLEAAWVDGEPQSTVSVLERGLHYGDGLFETIACLPAGPRFLERHLRRLQGGCERLGFPPLDFAKIAHELRREGREDRAVLKLLVTRGVARARGYGPSGEEAATRVTLRYGWPEDDAEHAQRGARVGISDLRLGENPALAGLKHCNRLEQVLARRALSGADFAEALMFSSSGLLISGTMSNVFLIRDDRLLTPRLDRCGVAGIMREVVLSLAHSGGIEAVEASLGAADLEAAQELFLTNALWGIRPVRELAGRALPVGPLTRTLEKRLAPLLAGAPATGAHA
jgi:4-amino-4-deoxychorismate lyase